MLLYLFPSICWILFSLIMAQQSTSFSGMGSSEVFSWGNDQQWKNSDLRRSSLNATRLASWPSPVKSSLMPSPRQNQVAYGSFPHFTQSVHLNWDLALPQLKKWCLLFFVNKVGKNKWDGRWWFTFYEWMKNVLIPWSGSLIYLVCSPKSITFSPTSNANSDEIQSVG